MEVIDEIELGISEFVLVGKGSEEECVVMNWEWSFWLFIIYLWNGRFGRFGLNHLM